MSRCRYCCCCHLFHKSAETKAVKFSANPFLEPSQGPPLPSCSSRKGKEIPNRAFCGPAACTPCSRWTEASQKGVDFGLVRGIDGEGCGTHQTTAQPPTADCQCGILTTAHNLQSQIRSKSHGVAHSEDKCGGRTDDVAKKGRRTRRNRTSGKDIGTQDSQLE
ncbi:uncharacterized protein LOC128259160 [Drosophila gunungcola]|uniref:Uncharacterized protein n=1 Tax=Drosophila gunungcola TaxID=103775 RepID=A0A9Q0BUG5_9MUSC|nr:uncharacterized protein LOC128259160 [Drosophila gunungcola]KAI8044254.1 hypothetical protein M5D96_000405 [Drosophila gunungcola]